MTQDQILRCRIRLFTWIFIVGLVVSGATAIPLRSEVEALIKFPGAEEPGSQPADVSLASWLFKVRDALRDVQNQYPFLFYGTDWLAFGHFAIALAFVGALRDPIRNRWLFEFGIIACLLVIPYAFLFGAMRGIPVWWRLVDAAFGVLGFVPLWFCRKWSRELELVIPGPRSNVTPATVRKH